MSRGTTNILPEDSEYGGWPASGEIDIMESRGNDDDRGCGCEGSQIRAMIGSTCHVNPLYFGSACHVDPLYFRECMPREPPVFRERTNPGYDHLVGGGGII